MNSVLQPRSHDPLRTEVHRLVIGGFIIALASACWYVLRPHLVGPLARCSVGGPGREALVAHALAQQNTPGFPSEGNFDKEYDARRITVTSYSLPEPGWVTWDWGREVVPSGSFSRPHTYKGLTGFADNSLRVRGLRSLTTYCPATPPGDMDGDGLWEVAYEYTPVPYDGKHPRDVSGWAVIRLGATHNEIVWAGLSDFEAWAKPGGACAIRPMWRDEDGDGVKELVFLTVQFVGRFGYGPADTVALFAWDHPGGVLRPRLLPRDSGFLSWPPADGGPVEVAQEADLEPILKKLLPAPDGFGFGKAAASQPATSPQGRPITPPR